MISNFNMKSNLPATFAMLAFLLFFFLPAVAALFYCLNIRLPIVDNGSSGYRDRIRWKSWTGEDSRIERGST